MWPILVCDVKPIWINYTDIYTAVAYEFVEKMLTDNMIYGEGGISYWRTKPEGCSRSRESKDAYKDAYDAISCATMVKGKRGAHYATNKRKSTKSTISNAMDL